MRLTANRLRKIIQEETAKVLREVDMPLWGCYRDSQYGSKLVCSVKAQSEGEAREKATRLSGDRNFADGYGTCKEISPSEVEAAKTELSAKIEELQAQLKNFEA
jgi:hypothetical protein